MKNFFARLYSATCGHLRSSVIDLYPDEAEEWKDAGDDSAIFFKRGTKKMKCHQCGCIYLLRREFMTKDKVTGAISFQ